MPRAILDENVSLQVGARLAARGYEVLAIAKQPDRGMSDAAVFTLAREHASLLVTRDSHFTNPVRFPPTATGGILYLTHGNLSGQDEAELVEGFLSSHPPKVFAGRLVLLSSTGVRIR